MSESLGLIVSEKTKFHRSLEYGPTVIVDTDILAAEHYVWGALSQHTQDGNAAETKPQ